MIGNLRKLNCRTDVHKQILYTSNYCMNSIDFLNHSYKGPLDHKNDCTVFKIFIVPPRKIGLVYCAGLWTED